MILRIHSSLLRRGYLVWIDTEMMKGSTMDAMSDAIEGAEVLLYGVSLKYKESASEAAATTSRPLGCHL